VGIPASGKAVEMRSIDIVYGTDVFCALVQRPALSRVDTRRSPR
jgi:hypothetical protein